MSIKKFTISLLAALVAAMGIITATATANNGGDNGEEGVTYVVCVGGETMEFNNVPPEAAAVIETALARGNAWWAEMDGQLWLLLSQEPDPADGWTNIREVSFTEGPCGAGGAAKPKHVALPPRVGVCSPQLIMRADGTMGHFHDITIAQWLDPDSPYHGMPAAKYAKGGPVNGITCDQLPGYSSTGQLVDGSGKQQSGNGQVYDEWVYAG